MTIEQPVIVTNHRPRRLEVFNELPKNAREQFAFMLERSEANRRWDRRFFEYLGVWYDLLNLEVLMKEAPAPWRSAWVPKRVVWNMRQVTGWGVVVVSYPVFIDGSRREAVVVGRINS